MIKTIRLFQFNVDDRTVPLFGQSFCERASASPSSCDSFASSCTKYICIIILYVSDGYLIHSLVLRQA